MSAEEIIAEFEQYLVNDGKAKKTLHSYLGDVKGFIQWIEGKGITFRGHFSNLHITGYKKFLMDNKYKVNTVNKKINSLQAFNHFLISTKRMDQLAANLKRDKIKIAMGSEQEIAVFSEEEVERILFYVDNSSYRNKLIIYLLLFTGLRVSELVNIKLKDMDLLGMQLTILGKGGKQREVPLKQEVVEAAKEYLEKERKNSKQVNSEYLLLTQRAGKMDRDAVNKLLKRMSKELGIPMYPHKYRHTFCTMLIKRGVDLTTVAKLAGHAGIQTTAKFYISTSKKDKQEAVNLL